MIGAPGVSDEERAEHRARHHAYGGIWIGKGCALCRAETHLVRDRVELPPCELDLSMLVNAALIIIAVLIAVAGMGYLGTPHP
jgi:hypothetical protein